MLVLTYIVHDEALDERVGVLVVRPSATLDALIVEVLQRSHRKLVALGDDLGIGVILYALANHVLSQLQQLLHENILQVLVLGLILLVDLQQCLAIQALALRRLSCTREEFLVDDDTTERRIGLQ